MWMKVDDGLHAHRKTRLVTRSDADKMRDAAPMGLWVLAGSWAARNNQDGWVPEGELDRWDDDWQQLAKRLVSAGYWWPEERDGESGYGFNDWGEWNNPSGPSESGTYGNHIRWHVNKGIVKPECEHCPVEPSEPDHIAPDSGATRPDHRPDIAPKSSPRLAPESLPVPIPEPKPVPEQRGARKAATGSRRATRARPLPDDWQPTDTHREYARKHGIPATEVDKFRSYHLAKGTTFKNWDQAFTNWLIKAMERPAQRVGTNSTPATRYPKARDLGPAPDNLSPEEYHDWQMAQLAAQREAACQ